MTDETPVNFGVEMMPPLFGLIAGRTTIALYPVFLLVMAFTMLVTAERTHRARRG